MSFPPVPPGTTDPNKIIATNIESAIANTLQSVTAFVDKSNAEAVDRYLNQTFPEWSKLASDGHADINNPPQPPRKIVVIYFTDQTTVSPNGPAPVRWPSWDFSNDPVCAMPPLPVRTPPPTIQLRTDILPVPLGDVSPVGSKVTDPSSGRVYIKKSSPTPFGIAYWYEQVSAIILLLLLCAGASRASAQVNLRFTPEPMAVPVSVLANARDLGRWSVIGCNDGVAPVAIASERIDMAAGPLRLVSNDDAMLVLTGHQRRSTAGTILHILSLAGQGVAIGVSVAGTIKNPVATTAIGIGSGLLPQLTTIVQGEVPSIVPLQSSVKYPVTLMPGGCFTDYRFAGKMKSPQVVMGVIK